MASENEKKLVFIYNADSGVISSLKDSYRKTFKSSSYPCNLCAVTFGNFGMKKDWKTYINNLDVPAEFLHKDEFNKQYSTIQNVKFPSAYLKKGSEFKLFISQEEMNKIQSVEELKNLVNNKLKLIA